MLSIFGTPFLWAAYYVFIPRLGLRVKRVIALCLISILHLIPGVWFALEDGYFTRVLNSNPSMVLFYCIVLLVAIIGVAFLSFPGDRELITDEALSV